MARNILEPCNPLSLDSCQKSSLWVHKEIDLAPHPVIVLMLQVGDAEKFPQALGLRSLDLSSQSELAGSMSQSHRGGWRRQDMCTI